jgi:hypothetical protein
MMSNRNKEKMGSGEMETKKNKMLIIDEFAYG